MLARPSRPCPPPIGCALGYSHHGQEAPAAECPGIARVASVGARREKSCAVHRVGHLRLCDRAGWSTRILAGAASTETQAEHSSVGPPVPSIAACVPPGPRPGHRISIACPQRPWRPAPHVHRGCTDVTVTFDQGVGCWCLWQVRSLPYWAPSLSPCSDSSSRTPRRRLATRK